MPLHEEVGNLQRMRIIGAMVEVSSAFGYIGAAVAPVVSRAGVSRSEFYELFNGREDCFLAACDWGVVQMRGAVLEAYGSQRRWRERVRHALAALLRLLDSEPQLARMCVVEALGAGKLVLAHRAAILEELMDALDAGAPRQREPGAPLLTPEGIVGGALAVIHGRLLELGLAVESNESPRLIELHGQLMALIALPYLGPQAAGEELTRPAPGIAQLPGINWRRDANTADDSHPGAASEANFRGDIRAAR